MKAILLMLGALSAAIIFVGCGTAVGRATGVDSSEVEEVLAEKDVLEIAQRDCQMQAYSFKRQRDGRSPEEFIRDCMAEATANISSSGGIDSDLEKAAEVVEQEMEIVKAGAEQVVEEKAMVEDLQNKCLSEFNSAKNRYGIGGTPRLNINQFMTECMNEGSKDLAVLGDIDVDVEKAIEEAEQEMEIVKAGAEQVVEEKAMVEDLQNKCLSEFNSAKNRYGIGGTPRLNINQFMTECMNEGSKDLAVLGDIDVDVEKAIEEAEQEMEIVKAGAEDVFEERVASLEEKVAELTKLLEALQTQ